MLLMRVLVVVVANHEPAKTEPHTHTRITQECVFYELSRVKCSELIKCVGGPFGNDEKYSRCPLSIASPDDLVETKNY